LFTGAAPAAEALANFSKPAQKSELAQEKRDGAVANTSVRRDTDDDPLVWHFQRDVELDEPSTQQDHQDKDPSLLSIATPAAEALVKFASTPQPNSPEKTWYDSDDSDIKEMVNFANQWGSQDQNEGSVQTEYRRLESIWKSNPHSADRQREPTAKTGSDTGETEVKTLENVESDTEAAEQDLPKNHETKVESTLDELTMGGQDSPREKRQREMSQSDWAKFNRKAVIEDRAAIVQKASAPKESIESPDRKKRAAPLPSRASNVEDNEASMTSSTAGDLANAVLKQIQEVPKEANAPSDPRKFNRGRKRATATRSQATNAATNAVRN
jgi:hypothetical protein